MEANKTQLQQVRSYLLKHGIITSWDAIMKFRITRLSEYIRILREQGFEIKMTRIQQEGKNWYGKYTLENDPT